MLRSAYANFTEHEFLFHDWDWIYERIDLVREDQRAERRWDLFSRLASNIAATPRETEDSPDPMAWWNDLVEQTLDAAERAAADVAETSEAEDQVEKDKAETLARFAEQLSQGGTLGVATITTF